MSIRRTSKRVHGSARLHQIFPTTPALHGDVGQKLARPATFEPAPTFSGDRVRRNWSIFCCLHKRGSAAKSAIREVPPVLARPGATRGIHTYSPGFRLWAGSCGWAPNSFRSSKNVYRQDFGKNPRSGASAPDLSNDAGVARVCPKETRAFSDF